jgi:hypothetical protein
MWPTEIGQALKSEAGDGARDKAYGKARKGIGDPPGDFKKNSMIIGEHLNFLFDDGVKLPSLEKLCSAVLAF